MILHQHIAFRYSFTINIVNMRHTTCFDKPKPLIYHQKPILCILCHITSYTTPSASFNFDQTSSPLCFQIKLQHKHSQYEAHDPFRYTPAPYIPPLYSLKPIVCFLCHITSYTTPLASFNFDDTSSTYCFQIQLHNKHSQYEAHDLLR